MEHPIVRYLPYQPHCFAFGGFELQMLSTYNAVKSTGLNIQKMDVWDRDDKFNILHCWGLGLGNYENVFWARKSKKKVVVTALSTHFETLKDIVKFNISSLVYKQRLVKEMAQNVDVLVVLNDLQADIYHKFYKVPKSKIRIIPNIVNDAFFNLRDKAMNSGNNDYLLCVGNICARKNQVLLASACAEKNIPLVLIGKTIPGEEQYEKRLKAIIENNANITWINGLKENSDELVDYFVNCKAFALPSFNEQQPISLLEAAILNKPLIIADLDYAKQKYYKNSFLVNPKSLTSIKNGVQIVMQNPETYIPDYDLLLNCKDTNVAKSYADIYINLV